MAEDNEGARPERPRDYDTPKTPEGTPPVIDPDQRERRAEELAGDEAAGAATTGKTEGNEAKEIDTELEKRQRQRTDREGAGEEELDSMHPETLFPPD